MVHSERNSKWYDEFVEGPDEDVVRMEVNSCFAYMKRLDDNQTLFKVVNNIDPKLDFIPSWLLNYAMSKGVATWLYRVTEYSENFKDTKFEKRYKKNPLYKIIRERMGHNDGEC
jgi:hypothetical protein